MQRISNFEGLANGFYQESRITSDMTVLEKVQNRDWLYLINSLIEKVEKGKSLKV